MKVNKGDLNPGKWFDFGKDENSFSLKLRVPVGEAHREIVKRCKDEKGEVDQEKLADELLDYCLPDWGNIEDENGPLDPTMENKKLIVGGVPEVASAYLRGIAKLNKALMVQVEEERKN